jgi:hypothetical protein
MIVIATSASISEKPRSAAVMMKVLSNARSTAGSGEIRPAFVSPDRGDGKESQFLNPPAKASVAETEYVRVFRYST